MLRFQNATYVFFRCLQNHSTPKKCQDSAFATSSQVETKLDKTGYSGDTSGILEVHDLLLFSKKMIHMVEAEDNFVSSGDEVTKWETDFVF